ncbi:segregation and condensation protein A [Fodinicurvata sediminis]|uniref:segregation and condensation protein A n=1 Tax=Fodinicurvata sediminis TaxID=1121832 RepID=UPI0003B60874|nr:ScpA family protein [Fodinicurvata sediminis]
MTGQEFAEDDRNEATNLQDGERLRLDLEGFEGPIDVLLQLSREQKVDLTRISILALAEQYLEFIRAARQLRLELAADYLVMAAWLAYLKSRLLLPEPEDGEEQPTGPEMAAALRYQLQRLEAMQTAGAELLGRPQLGQLRWCRGMPEDLSPEQRVVYDVSLYDLLQAYGTMRARNTAPSSLRVLSLNLYSVENAIKRLSGLVGKMPGWHTLMNFLPYDLQDGLSRRSAVASTFVASLELCKSGQLEIRQDGTFGPIYLRACDTTESIEDS